MARPFASLLDGRNRSVDRRIVVALAVLLTIAPLGLSNRARGGEAEAEGAPPPLFKNADAQDAVNKLRASFEASEKIYHASLERLKALEARKNNVEEVVRIETALSGKDPGEFEGYGGKRAAEKWNDALVYMAEGFVKNLESAQRKVLVSGETDEAVHINALLEELQPLIPGRRTKAVNTGGTGRVVADRDWQRTGVTVEKGAKVTVEARGQWSSGARKRLGKGESKKIYNTPDQLNVMARVGERNVGRGGDKWEFTAPVDGEIELRRAGYGTGNRASEASGSLSWRIAVEAPEGASGGLEGKLREILGGNLPKSMAKAASAEGAVTKRVAVRANADWQDAGVEVEVGDQIHFAGTGSWSRGKERNGKLVEGDTDTFPYQVKIGGRVVGQGGTNFSTVAPVAGKVELRMAGYGHIAKKFKPQGSVSVTVTVSKKE